MFIVNGRATQNTTRAKMLAVQNMQQDNTANARAWQSRMLMLVKMMLVNIEKTQLTDDAEQRKVIYMIRV